jgi:hypothetical protein
MRTGFQQFVRIFGASSKIYLANVCDCAFLPWVVDAWLRVTKCVDRLPGDLRPLRLNPKSLLTLVDRGGC